MLGCFFFFFLVQSTRATIIKTRNIPTPAVIPKTRGRLTPESCFVGDVADDDICEGSDLEDGLLEAGVDDPSDGEGVVGESLSCFEREEEDDLCGEDEGRDGLEEDDEGAEEDSRDGESGSSVESGDDGDGASGDDSGGDESRGGAGGESDGGSASWVGGAGGVEVSGGGAVAGDEAILRRWSSNAEHSALPATARLPQPADCRTRSQHHLQRNQVKPCLLVAENS